MTPRAAGGHHDLAWLLAPIGPSEFFDKHYERRPLHVESRPVDYFSGLFGIDDVERYLFGVRPESGQFRVFRNGAKAEQVEREIARNPDRAPGALKDGCTIILNGAQRFWPPLREMIADLSSALACPIIVNVYCSGPGSQGLDTHIDTHDVFVAQTTGSKRWRLYDVPYTLPLEGLSGDLVSLGLPEAKGFEPFAIRATPTSEAVLQPGELLYIPRGVPHDAIAQKDLSIHLTLGLHPRTWYHALAAMVQLAAMSDPDLRASIPLAVRRHEEEPPSASELGHRFAASLDKAAARWSTKDVVSIFARDMALQADGAGPGRYLRSILEIERLNTSSTVELRPGLRLTFEVRGGEIHLTFPGGAMTGPRKIAPAVAFIAQEGSCDIGQLPGLSAPEQLVLARRLIREGLLQVAESDSR